MKTALPLLLSAAGLAAQTKAAAAEPPTFRRVVIDQRFVSEAVTAADVDRDGDRDLLVGDFWYEAPSWQPHAIRPHRGFGDGAHGYSECFACWTDDLDGDGFLDQIVVGMPGTPAHWYRNPSGDGKHWIQHRIADNACNESPHYVDLFGDKKRVLLMATQPEGEMCWFAPGSDPTQPWERHALSAPKAPCTERFSHGLGVGDLDGDGRSDVLVTAGYWQQPEAARAATQPWPFVAADFGQPCAHMHVLRLDAKAPPAVVSSAAHARGVWWHQQQAAADGAVRFERSDLLTTVTQTHALCTADVDGDGQPDLITGKRFWAHGPDGDEDAAGTPVLLWLSLARDAATGAVQATPHVIDDASGIGAAFVAEDIDGDRLVDVAVANKKGVFLFLQQPRR